MVSKDAELVKTLVVYVVTPELEIVDAKLECYMASAPEWGIAVARNPFMMDYKLVPSVGLFPQFNVSFEYHRKFSPKILNMLGSGITTYLYKEEAEAHVAYAEKYKKLADIFEDDSERKIVFTSATVYVAWRSGGVSKGTIEMELEYSLDGPSFTKMLFTGEPGASLDMLRYKLDIKTWFNSSDLDEEVAVVYANENDAKLHSSLRLGLKGGKK